MIAAEERDELPLRGRRLRRSSTVGWTHALLSTARIATLFNVPLAIAAGWLLWHSLDWPLVGDATIFHFIAGQFQMGAVPYRDIFDINMPLIYYIHAAVVAIGGMSDVAWRAFDLSAALLMSGLILMLVWPAGRAVAILAVLIVLVTHFLLGPYSAGQRDFLMSIPALAAALASAKAAEDKGHGHFYLMLVGAFAMTAASIKPSGILLLLLPVFARVERDWHAPLCVILGATANWAGLLGSVEPCLAPSLAGGYMPARHGHHARLASAAAGADTNKDVSVPGFRFGHAGCARRPTAAWRARSNARFGRWGLPGHGACWNATGHAAYPMVLSCLCGGFRSARFSCRAGGQSAGRHPLDQLPVAAAARFRCRRSLA